MARSGLVARAGDRRLLTGAASLVRIFLPSRATLKSERRFGLMGKKHFLTKATTKQLGLCQVRSETEHLCIQQAMVEIHGMPFCESCARESRRHTSP